jgi:hypothetical protein
MCPARAQRRAEAFAIAERAVTAAIPAQLEELAMPLESLVIAARLRPRPRVGWAGTS